MAKDPAFLFYPNDYIGGTMGMTFEEKGAYMELLMMQFNRGHMTSHMIGQTVGQIWDNIKVKFSIDADGLYYNARLDKEIDNRKTFVNSRRNNLEGKNQYTKNSGHMDGRMTSHMEDEDVNRNRDSNLDKKKGVKGEKETSFDVFWKAYPKKVGKDAAKKSFAKVKLDISVLLEAIEKQKKSEQWTKDGGQYIPNPATWLNQGRWEDELPEKKGGSSNAGTNSTEQWAGLNITKLG